MAENIDEKDRITARDILNWLKIAGYGTVVFAGVVSFGYCIGWYAGYGLAIRDVCDWMKAYQPEAFNAFRKAFPKLIENLKLS